MRLCVGLVPPSALIRIKAASAAFTVILPKTAEALKEEKKIVVKAS